MFGAYASIKYEMTIYRSDADQAFIAEEEIYLCLK